MKKTDWLILALGCAFPIITVAIETPTPTPTPALAPLRACNESMISSAR